MDGSVVNHAPELTVKSLAQSVLFKRVSNRYQRFKECELREGDICIVRDDLSVAFDKFGEVPKLPGWAVLNLKTFSIYEATNFQTVAKAFNLKDVQIADWPKDINSCWTMSDGHTEPIVLCSCPFTQQSPAMVKANWIMDIEHFRDDCKASDAHLTPSELAKAQNPTDLLLGAGVNRDDILKLQNEHQKKMADEIEEGKEEEVKKDLGCNVTETARLAYEAMKKELQSEDLREKEE